MPIYEYLCSDCGIKFELLRPMKEADTPLICQHCESVNVSRSISVFFAQSGGRVITRQASTGCSTCPGGSCSTCNL